MSEPKLMDANELKIWNLSELIDIILGKIFHLVKIEEHDTKSGRAVTSYISKAFHTNVLLNINVSQRGR
jgi:hypothetical protein